MITSPPSRLRRIIHRFQRTWSEFDHAERRLFEIRTGVPATRQARRRTEVETLEALYTLQAAGAADRPLRPRC